MGGDNVVWIQKTQCGIHIFWPSFEPNNELSVSLERWVFLDRPNDHLIPKEDFEQSYQLVSYIGVHSLHHRIVLTTLLHLV
jgi:hypothetical protein